MTQSPVQNFYDDCYRVRAGNLFHRHTSLSLENCHTAVRMCDATIMIRMREILNTDSHIFSYVLLLDQTTIIIYYKNVNRSLCDHCR